MSLKTTALYAVISSFFFLTACSKVQDSNYQSLQEAMQGFSQEISAQISSKSMQVTDLKGQPIANAQVLIGMAENNPFPGNYLTTDQSGNFKAPAGWKNAEMVTIAAPGYVRVTYLGQIPKGQQFQLRPVESQMKYELKGRGLGFNVKNNDNLVDFALMMPVVKKQDLFAFDMDLFISPESDVVTVFGQKLYLPSNVSVPRQTENYGLIGVTVEKIQYRLYFDALGRQLVYAARGQFPFKQVVSELNKGKTFVDVINYFSLKGGSLREAQIAGETQGLDIPVNEMVFDQHLHFTSPSFQEDEFMLAASLKAMNGSLMPTDLKTVPSNTTFKMTTSLGENQLLIALKKKSEQQMLGSGKFSAAIVAFHEGIRPELLPLLENPQVVNELNFRVTLPTLPAQIIPVATYSVLSTVERRGEGAEASEVTKRVWEVYANEWIGEVNLPQWPGEALPAGAKRWEMTLVAAPSANKAIDLSPRILETVTHATHSASDF